MEDKTKEQYSLAFSDGFPLTYDLKTARELAAKFGATIYRVERLEDE